MLKPQREGGGNNLYGAELKAALEGGHPFLIENLGEAIDAALMPVVQRATIKRGSRFYVKLGEDEVVGAAETALDERDEELEMKDQMKTLVQHPVAVVQGGHRLDREISEVSAEQLRYARIKPGEGSTWELFADEGEMKMYKREEEVDGMVVDPLKALHSVTGVTAWELCHYFWSPDVRLEWEHTIDAMTVLEEVDSTLIFHQVHKRVWPTAQRDAVFWSHMKQVPPSPEEAAEGVVDCWLVTNKSTDHKAAPQGQGLRAGTASGAPSLALRRTVAA